MTLETVEPRALGELAGQIDDLGYSALWYAEARGRESFTQAGLLLSGSSRLVVASGIASIWARDAVAAAAASRTLNAAYRGRFLLGLGVSHQPLVERLRGHQYTSPLATMRDYLAALDHAEMISVEGDEPFARVIAALGPAMLELGATRANGVHTYLVTPEHTREARARVGDSFLAVEQAVVLATTREEFLRRAHAHLDFYTGLENYRASWRRAGFSEADFIRGGSERLCEAMVVHGDEWTIAERVALHHDAGADHVCLQVLGEDARPPIEEWRRLAPALLS